MDVFSLVMRLKEEGAAQVKSSIDKLNRSFDEASGKAKVYDMTVGSLKDTLSGLASGLALGAVMTKIIDETSGAEFAAAQLNATLKSTNYAAGLSADALNRHAQALAQMSIYDDDAITGAQSLLATFVKIQGDTFPRATQAVLDLATKMGTDLNSAVVQVGKALNDPIQGISALSRVGVRFTDAQKAMIEQLVNSNRVMAAQKIILTELETEFGGSAKAASETFGGAIKRLNNELGNLLTLSGDNSSMAVTLINGLTNAIIGLNDALSDLSRFLTAANTRTRPFLDFLREVSEINMFTPLVMLAARGKQISADIAETATNAGRAFTALESYQKFGITGPGTAIPNENAAKAGKSYVEMLTELVGLLPITTTEQQKLTAEEKRLTRELGATNLSMAQRLKLAKDLSSVQEALSKATIKYTLDEAAARFKAQAGTFGAGRTKIGFEVAPIDPQRVKTAVGGIRTTFDSVRASMSEEINKTATELRGELYMTLGNALVTGIEAAFLKGANFGSAMKAFGAALLAGLGSIMVAFGQRLVPLGIALKVAMQSFKSGDAPKMIAAGLAIMAIGAALRGAAGRAMDSTGFGGDGGGYTAPAVGSMGGGAMTMPTAYYGPTSAAGASTIERVNPVSVTVIGPNDPVAQRQLQEFMRNAQRRGSA